MTRQRAILLRWAPAIGVVGAILLWQVAATFGPVSTNLFPGPFQVLQSAINYPVGQLFEDVKVSLLRLLAGFGLAILAGVVLGALSAGTVLGRRLINAPMELLRPIPPLAWIAVAVIWLGLGESPKVFIIFVAAVFPIYVATVRGLKTIDPTLTEAGRSLGVTRRGVMARIQLPAAAPDIATGLRVGWGLAFTALVGAEVISAKSGLGYMVMEARSNADIPLIVYGVFVIGVLGWVTDWLIQKLLMERYLAWHFRGVS
mgnify:CR=1 FL=1